jgi:tRNA uridine 5-carbamoylmethylation protein Kti12
MIQNYFYLMVGMPCSGKSTWINGHVVTRRHPDNPVILDTDSLIENYAKIENTTYDQVFKKYINKATELFLENLDYYIISKRNIMIDRTNLTKVSRAKILNKVPNFYKKVAVVFNCSEEEMRKRLVNRPGKHIPWKVIEDMKLRYEEPSIDEGFSSITKIYTGGVKNETI